MDLSTAMGWVFLLFLVLSSSILGGAIILYWHNRKQLVGSLKYLLDRLEVAETDIHKTSEELLLINEYLRRKGLLYEEDLASLRRELIEIPRQLEAEKNELLKAALEKDEEERVIKNVPDTFH